ncbi:MAG: alpha/beta hydrolase, partial [Hymenobacteraceae bacterium]|nr:alpha/beta hydrolase [Hymenobacteraceae bacterium]
MRKAALLLLFVLLFLLYYSNFTAMGAVIDTRLLVVLLSILALGLSLLSIMRGRRPFLYILGTLSLLLFIFAIHEYFLRYKQEEITFKQDGNTLYGTLYTPRQSTSSCLVVFIHGSGQQERKEYAFHARQLARNGIAGFAYDKRGSGESEGDTYAVGYKGYAQDAVAAIQKLQDMKGFEQVGLFAVSEGEWVSLLVDALTNIDFIVMISAAGTSPLDQTHRELTYRLSRKGFAPEAIRRASELYRDILTFENDSAQKVKLKAEIGQVQHEPWFSATEEFPAEVYYYPWWNKVMYFDPHRYLSKTDTDILVLVGKENESYPYTETLTNFGRYDNAKVAVFDKADHAMLNWRLGKGIPPPA